MGCFRLLAIADNAAMDMELQYLFESLLSILFFFFSLNFFFGHAVGQAGSWVPDQRLDPSSLHWQLGVLTLRWPGKPLCFQLFQMHTWERNF